MIPVRQRGRRVQTLSNRQLRQDETSPLTALSRAFDRFRRGIQRAGDNFSRMVFQRTAKPKSQSQLDVFHGSNDRRRDKRDAIATRSPDACDEVVCGRSVGDEKCLAFGGDAISLPARLVDVDGGVTHVLKPCEGRIDYARARRIAAAHALLDSFHEVIAMRGIVGNHREKEEAQLPVIERTFALPAPVMSVMLAVVPVMATAVVRFVVHVPDIDLDISGFKIKRPSAGTRFLR